MSDFKKKSHLTIFNGDLKMETEKFNKKLLKEFENCLTSKASYGQSRHKAKLDGTDNEKIFSKQTMKNYKQYARQFAKFVYEQNQNCRHMKQAKKYIDPFLQSLIDSDKSPYTISSYKASLTKIYGQGCSTVEVPVRERKNITKNKGEKWLGHFDPIKNKKLVDFCKASGLRRSEIEDLTYDDLTGVYLGEYFEGIMTPKAFEKGYYSKGITAEDLVPAIKVNQGKGGKQRYALFLNGKLFRELCEEVKANPQLKTQKIFGKVPKYTPCHQYRKEYAQSLYCELERDSVPSNEVYQCRKDKLGTSYDRRAMKMVSRSMGHNRICVIAEHYL